MFTKLKESVRGMDATRIGGLCQYSLKDTLECGQCFRYELVTEEEGYVEYLFTASGRVIRVGQEKPGELIFYGIDDRTLEDTVIPLFSLERDLDAVRDEIKSLTDSEWLRTAADRGAGVAILSQEPFEALISFIISQNNNIPRIRKIIKTLAAEYGVNITLHGEGEKKCPLGKVSGTPCEEICKNCGVCYSFPKAEDILKRPEGLVPCRAGFRQKYILDACQRVAEGLIDLDAVKAKGSYTATREALTSIKGVGDKVAACVALFAMGNLEAFPIDVWMKRAIETYFDGDLDHEALGRYAGVAQQYIFHYIRNIEGK